MSLNALSGYSREVPTAPVTIYTAWVSAQSYLASLSSKFLKFERLKIRFVTSLPNLQKINCIVVSYPVLRQAEFPFDTAQNMPLFDASYFGKTGILQA